MNGEIFGEIEMVGLEDWLAKQRRVKSEGWHPVSGWDNPVDRDEIHQERKYNKE